MARETEAVRLGSAPSAVGVLSRLACAEAKRAGVALPLLLAKANLTPAQIDDPRCRLAARDQVSLLNLVAEALDDDLLGFHLARRCDLREWGLLYYVAASAGTWIEALRRTVRYASLSNEGALLDCALGSQLEVSLAFVGVGRHLDRQQAECWATLVVRLLRELTGQHVSASRTRFVHVRTRIPEELALYFGGDVEFAAAADTIEFPRTIGSAAIVSADPYLHRLLVQHCEEALAHRRPRRGGLQAQVEDTIAPLLPHAEVHAGDVARRLGLSRRTLARRLAAEDVTYSRLLDHMRRDLANRYLADADASISQIAWLLGYRETSAFSRAFKRWTGKSPRAARAGGQRGSRPTPVGKSERGRSAVRRPRRG